VHQEEFADATQVSINFPSWNLQPRELVLPTTILQAHVLHPMEVSRKPWMTPHDMALLMNPRLAEALGFSDA
jgi:hypothetical protein